MGVKAMARVLGAVLVMMATAAVPGSAQQAGSGGWGVQLFQGTVPEYSATISGFRAYIAGPDGLGIEAMLEASGGLVENVFGEEDTSDYAAFNLQLGAVKRFGSLSQGMVPYVAGGWYPAFERTGDVTLTRTGLFYVNGGAELMLFDGVTVFAEGGLGLSGSAMPFILRFGLGGTGG